MVREKVIGERMRKARSQMARQARIEMAGWEILLAAESRLKRCRRQPSDRLVAIAAIVRKPL